MKGNYYVEAVNYSTSGTVAAGGSNTGNGTVIVNSNLPKNIMSTSTVYQTMAGEVLNLECITDESGGATLGRETFEVLGKEFKSKFDADWPAGSGIKKHLTVTCAKTDGNLGRFQGPGRNLLRNSNFESWDSTNVLTNWTATQVGSASYVGATGPQQQNTTADYIWNADSSGNLKLIGDSSGWKHKIYQSFNSPTGTRGRVEANKNYVLSCRVRIAAGSGTVGGSAAMKFVIEDAAGNATSATKTLDVAAIGTSWVHVSQPWDLSDTEIKPDARFAMEVTTAIPNGKSIVIDELVLAERVQMYPGGPGFIIARGSADYRTGDTFTVTYAHSASPPANKWQFYFDRFFNTAAFNYNLPSAGGSAIADSLIG
jgi:hypothetical protein